MAEWYSQALDYMQKAESMPRGDPRQELYINARREFERVTEFVEKSQLFSENESIDDIATADLKYLLVPAYLAKILISSECSSNRLQTFERAESLLRKFLRITSKYGLCDSNIDSILNKNEQEHPDTLGANSITIGIQNAMQTRNEKIEKFKKMKLLGDKIDQLEALMKSKQVVDDEIAREYYLNLIQKWIAESLESLEREVRPALYFERNLSTAQSSKLQSTDKELKNKLPLKTFTLVKNNMQKEVFGLGYPSRPTVTVDEFINQKMENKELSFQTQKEIYANSLQRYAEKPNLLREQEELSDAEHDEKEDRDDADELGRKRRWDEFKDENPRGSGNRHNMG